MTNEEIKEYAFETLDINGYSELKSKLSIEKKNYRIFGSCSPKSIDVNTPAALGITLPSRRNNVRIRFTEFFDKVPLYVKKRCIVHELAHFVYFNEKGEKALFDPLVHGKEFVRIMYSLGEGIMSYSGVPFCGVVSPKLINTDYGYIVVDR